MRRLPALAVLSPAAPAAANPWRERRVLDIAHQGGEIEAPSNTLHALRTVVAKGSDILEIDVRATADRELVVIHDASVDRTTDGRGHVDAMTLGQVQALDAAHWFVPGYGTCRGRADGEHALEDVLRTRGVRVGEPAG